MTPTPSLDVLLAGAVADGTTTGVYVMAADADGIVYSGGAGTRDGTRPWTPDTVAWLASMTKSIVAVAALQLVEQQRIALDAPVGDVLPELASPQVLEGFDGDRPRLRPAVAPVTLRRLLSHTAGVGYPFLSADLVRYHELRGIPPVTECRLSTLVDSPLVSEPGTFGYSMSIDWVGLLIARLAGRDLDTSLRETIFDPLGMDDTGYRIVDRDRLAAVHARTPAGLVTIPFEIPQQPEALSGGAGLYGSPRDYLTFLRTIMAGGTSPDGVTMLGPDLLAEARSRQTAPIGPMRSVDTAMSRDVELLPGVPTTWSLLGMRNEEASPAGRPPGTLAWAGMANSYYWVDASSAAVVFTQILPFADPAVIGLVADVEGALRSPT